MRQLLYFLLIFYFFAKVIKLKLLYCWSSKMPCPNHRTLSLLHGLLLSSSTYAHVHSRHTDLSQATNMSSRAIFFLSFTASSRFNTRNRPFKYPYISHFVSCFLSVWNTRRSSSKKRHDIPPWASYGSFIKDRIKWNYKRLNILKKGATEYETRRHSKAFMLIIKSHKTLCHDCNYQAFFFAAVFGSFTARSNTNI